MRMRLWLASQPKDELGRGWMFEVAWRLLPLFVFAFAACVKIPAIPVEGSVAPNDGEKQKPQLLWQGKSVVELYELGEIRQFDFFQSGKLIGHIWGRFDGVVDSQKPGQYRFSLKFELTPPDPTKEEQPTSESKLRSESEVIVDAHGRLIYALEKGGAAEQKITANANVLELERNTGLGKLERKTLSFSPESAFLGYLAPVYQELMLATRDLYKGKHSWRAINISTFDPSEWTGDFSEHEGELQIRTGLGELLTFREGRLSAINLEDSEIELLAAVAPATWPEWKVEALRTLVYRPAEGASFSIRQIELTAQPEDAKLVGDLLIPAGRKGPAAGVVFLSASGLTDRYGFAGPPATDLGSHEITDALAESGFVVLRYDEPGRGDSEEALLSWKKQLTDARRAVQTLLVQPEVDPSNIFIVGHGEGGWRGLKIAKEFSREVRGVALLASHAKSYRKIMKDAPEVVRGIESGVGVPDALLPYLHWYREIMSEEPEQIVRTAPCPIWVAQASKDFEVDAQQATIAYEKWIKNLPPKRRKPSQVRLFANLDHLFKDEPGESSHERYLVKRPVNAAFLKSLSDWMTQQLQK